MGRAKFLVDAERCIECNACVTACKNEHEVPWGINRRKVVTINDGSPGERSISVACIAPTRHVWRSVQRTVFIRMRKGWYYTLKTFASDVVTAFMHVPLAHRNFHKLEILDLVARWTNVPFALVDQKKHIPLLNLQNMAETALRKANCQFVRKCAQLKLC